MIWPFLLAIGLTALGAAWLVRDHRAVWVSMWCTVGIVAMQIPVPEPGRWIWAATLWTFLALLVGVRRGCVLPATILWIVPLGYAGLAAIDFGTVPVGTGWRDMAFGVTEVGWLAALFAGGRRLPRGLWNIGRRWHRGRLLDRGGTVSMEAVSPPKESQAP